jgi:hypothetical protein
MIQTGVEGVGFAAINTDAQALAKFKGIATAVNIGRDVTRGLGAGKICALHMLYVLSRALLPYLELGVYRLLTKDFVHGDALDLTHP